MTAEQWLAGAVLAVCVVLLVRLLIGERRRWRLDAALGRGARTLRRRWHDVRRWAVRRRARREAASAIERARRVDRDGNVYRPKSFKRSKPPRQLH